MYKRILVPLDGSATSIKGLDEAIRLASLTGARLRLIHVVDELLVVTGFETYPTYVNEVVPLLKQQGERILEDAKARALAGGATVETKLLECLGHRASEIILDEARAWNADLVVLGTHGRRGFRRLFLGSDAEQISRSSTVPVLLVRAPEQTQNSLQVAPVSSSTPVPALV